MNKEIKAQWVTALTSGEYKQTQKHLQDSKGFCCLGVLCDLHSKAKGLSWTRWPGGERGIQVYLSGSSLLPYAVKEWAGLDTCFGAKVSIGGDLVCLPDHNDAGCTFAEIAKAIDEQL